MIKFGDIPGRTTLKKRLENDVLAGHVGHAYILEGPAGCGKRDIARAFAYMILCMSEKDEKPCGKCRHCTMVNAGGTGELYELLSEKESISINLIRELQQNINFIPVSGDKKVYLIIDADNMTIPAQNCILKTIEEPPAYATIIMTASKSDRFIETIKSRVVSLQVAINSVEEIEKYLKKNTQFEYSKIKIAARCANGSIGKAMNIVGSEDFTAQRNSAIEFAGFLISKDYDRAYSATASLSMAKNDIFYSSLSGLFRDMLVMNTTGNINYLINGDKKDIIIRGSERYPEHILGKMISIINDSSDRILANAAKKQTMDAMVVKITEELAGW